MRAGLRAELTASNCARWSGGSTRMRSKRRQWGSGRRSTARPSSDLRRRIRALDGKGRAAVGPDLQPYRLSRP